MVKRYDVERAARALVSDLRGLTVGSRIGTYDALSKRLGIRRGWVRDVLMLVEREGYIAMAPRRQAILIQKPAPLPVTPPKPIELALQRVALARDLARALPETPQGALDSQIAMLITTLDTACEVITPLANEVGFDFSIPEFKIDG